MATSRSNKTTSFADRADHASISPLARYLLSLVSIKLSNLCVSADVHTTDELLEVAEEVGDHICVLKTHADIIDDFSDRTIRGLQEISQRKHFLIFEDRKFGDIGNTLQSQYTRGPLRIADWAHLTNAHLLPGPSIIPSLRSAANSSLASLNQSVATTISTGNARISLDSAPSPTSPRNDTILPELPSKPKDSDVQFQHHRRSTSKTLTATTTISQTIETTSTSPPPALLKSLSTASVEDNTPPSTSSALSALGPPPHARALLLLAQMSSEGTLMTKEYTNACVAAAREYPDFVCGYICQENLNSRPEDCFISFTPGVGMPKEGELHQGKMGDGKGQVWRTPEVVVGREGVDVIIVGRGILGVGDRRKEAERYRSAAWKAYEGRIKEG